jgi:FkbM family methyltransferase
MEDKVVLYQGMYWLKDDGEGVTEESAAENSACWQLLNNFPDVPQKISEHVKNRRVVVQAGGNNGLYAKQYADLFETVYTFEPVPELFYCLNRNITKDNVFKFQACLGDNHVQVGLGRKVDNNAGSANVFGSGVTPTLMIDDLGLNNCDLIHLDIEGFEFFALKGASKTINKFKPVIVLETAGWSPRYGISTLDILKLLKDFGYKMSADVQGDIVFIPSDIEILKPSEIHSVFNKLKLPLQMNSV